MTVASFLRRAAGTTLLLAATATSAQVAICYNCPPEWADWGSELRAIKEKTGVTVPPRGAKRVVRPSTASVGVPGGVEDIGA